ncbi:MAG: hypothetical protein IIY28_05635, partial [Lachnospiraceae bacterium]|nr:hypothetical protein [Lachnospiraceae bacterium]
RPSIISTVSSSAHNLLLIFQSSLCRLPGLPGQDQSHLSMSCFLPDHYLFYTKNRKNQYKIRQIQGCTHLSRFAFVSRVFPGRYAKKYTGYYVMRDFM